MKQTVGIRFSEHGQVLVCVYDVPEGAPLLAPSAGVMVSSEHGPAFGRVVWQHMRQDSETEQEEQCSTLSENVPASSLNGTPSGEREMTAETGPEDPCLSTNACLNETTAKNGNKAHGDASPAARGHRDEKGPREEEVDPLAAFHPGTPVQLATPEELAIAVENERISREARAYCRRCIAERQLDMKLVDVETLFDHSKMIFYFTAPTRIDFRELVKDLVRQYRTRIELRQIGVRHETQMLGALGNCGMVCCCRRYLRKFAPVTIKMAKEQNLFLNPAKISGICGRLLCCLSYEQENYDAFHRSCPKLGKRYQTDNGPMRVLRGNMFRNTVVTLPDGGQETELTLDEWKALNPHRSESVGTPPLRENRPAQDFMVVSAAPDTLDADLAEFAPEADETSGGQMPESGGRPNSGRPRNHPRPQPHDKRPFNSVTTPAPADAEVKQELTQSDVYSVPENASANASADAPGDAAGSTAGDTSDNVSVNAPSKIFGGHPGDNRTKRRRRRRPGTDRQETQ